MFGLPEFTEFNKRIPKQKFYENINIKNEIKRCCVEQIRGIYWKNKIAATTVNLKEGKEVKEIEVLRYSLMTENLMRLFCGR